jgi:hypothetical protein
LKRLYKILLVVIITIIALSFLSLSVTEDASKISAILNKQFVEDEAIIKKVQIEKKVNIPYYTTYTPSAVEIHIDFSHDVPLEKRIELLNEIVKEISSKKYSGNNSYPLDGSKISYGENYAMITSSVLMVSNKYVFQKGILHPVAGFLYTGPTKNYRINETSFTFRINSLFLFVKLPYGFHNTTVPPYFGKEFVVSEVFDFIDVPSSIIYDYAPVTFYSLKLTSVEHELGMFVYPGTEGIIRSLGEELILKTGIR